MLAAGIREVNPMALKAFVLIESEPGKSRDIAVQLKKIDGVHSVATVTGPHDVIAYVETADSRALGDLLIGKIQKIDGIAGTLTDVVID